MMIGWSVYSLAIQIPVHSRLGHAATQMVIANILSKLIALIPGPCSRCAIRIPVSNHLAPVVMKMVIASMYWKQIVLQFGQCMMSVIRILARNRNVPAVMKWKIARLLRKLIVKAHWMISVMMIGWSVYSPAIRIPVHSHLVHAATQMATAKYLSRLIALKPGPCSRYAIRIRASSRLDLRALEER